MSIKKELLQTYSVLKQQEKQLEEQISDVKKRIQKEMADEQIDSIESDVGTFTMVERASWSYPEEISKLEDEVKEAKESAKAKGFAEKSTYSYLRFSPVRESSQE